MPNPHIADYNKDRQKGKYPLRVRRTLRMSEQMWEAIAKLDRDWTDIAREAIAEELRKKGVEIE
ncbi:MAG: hypothetical protein ACRC2R_25425 [Xenococcaceae cyanobacterium]